MNLGVDDNAVGLPFETSKFEKLTQDAYTTLVDGMKTGGSLEVDGNYDSFLNDLTTNGSYTAGSVTVNYIK